MSLLPKTVRRNHRADGGPPDGSDDPSGMMLPKMTTQQAADAFPASLQKQLGYHKSSAATPAQAMQQKNKPVNSSTTTNIKPLYNGYARGGRPRYAIGGEVLPDIISGIGDVVGAFFGDPGAGDQGVGILSNLDGGRTKGAGVETQLLGMAEGKGHDQVENSATGSPGTGLNALFNPSETNAEGKFGSGIGQEAGNGAGIAASFFKKGGLVPQHFDIGGSVSDGEVSMFHNSGLFASQGAGRTDIHNRDVPPGGYVVPADVVSGLAEGNTLGGSAVIDRMMNTGPYGVKPGTGPEGMKLQKGHGRGDFPRQAQLDAPRAQHPQGGLNEPMYDGYAKGGLAAGKKKENTGPVPVVVAGGEHYIPPEAIAAKFGDLDRGHKILDAWVVDRRKRIIKEMQKLPGPKK